MTDERKGLPSASSALEDSICHARFRMQREWLEATQEEVNERDEELFGQSDSREHDETIDSDAESGRRIHKLYAGQACPEATAPEVQRAELARGVDARMFQRWMEGSGGETSYEVRERRIWLEDEDGNAIYSGQPDVFWVRAAPARTCDILVGDLKGLWGHHDPSRINVQIRRYIALIAATVEELGYSKVNSAACYLNQPAVTLEPQLTVYSREDIEDAVIEMHMEVLAISDPTAEPTPHPRACHHCKAKLACLPFQTQAQLLPATTVLGVEPPEKKELKERVEALSGAKLAMLLPWGKALVDMNELAQTEARRRLRSDPESVPGYKLKPNADRSKIVDVKKVWQHVSAQYHVKADDFMAKVGITKAAVAEMIRDHSELKGMALDAEVLKVVDGATNPIKVSPSLERAK